MASRMESTGEGFVCASSQAVTYCGICQLLGAIIGISYGTPFCVTGISMPSLLFVGL